jgi:hypothetical protein
VKDMDSVKDMKWYQYEAHLLLIGLYIFCVVVADLIISFAGALWALFIGLVWGTLNVIVPWAYVNLRFFPAYQEQLQTEIESTWGFGQIMQVVFLALPILAFLEPFLGKKHPGPFLFFFLFSFFHVAMSAQDTCRWAGLSRECNQYPWFC